jgi:hypothetical protein
MLRRLEKQLSTSGEPVQWEVIHARMKSPLTITVAAKSVKKQKRLTDKIVRTCVSGLRKLESEPKTPPFFDDEALEAVKKLASVTRHDGAKVKLFIENGEEASVDERAVANVKVIGERARAFVDYSTIEGKLELISTHNGDSFAIWETLTNHKIECLATPEQLEQAKAALRRRVSVSGRVRYRNDKPVTMTVESIRVLREQAELPQPGTMAPINITDGASSEEFIRRLRDAR